MRFPRLHSPWRRKRCCDLIWRGREHDRDRRRHPRSRPIQDEDIEDIYAENGSIRSDFLTLVGAAIADRDLLFLRQHASRACTNRTRRPDRGDPAGSAYRAGPPARRRLRHDGADRGRRGDPPADRRASARRADRRSDPASSIPTTPSTFSKTSTTRTARKISRSCPSPNVCSCARPRLSGKLGRSAHADGIRRRAAVLDGRPDDRLHARRGGCCRRRSRRSSSSTRQLLGTVDLEPILRTSAWRRSRRSCAVASSIPAEMDQEEAARS